MNILLENMNLIVFFVLLSLGYFIGKRAEKKHYENIQEREKALLHIPIVTMKSLTDPRPVEHASLQVGTAVVSVDYYKRFLAFFRMTFGGELASYSSLIDRGRREAILRMKESCPEADIFVNFRFETCSLSNGKGKKTACVEILAYGTAIQFENP